MNFTKKTGIGTPAVIAIVIVVAIVAAGAAYVASSGAAKTTTATVTATSTAVSTSTATATKTTSSVITSTITQSGTTATVVSTLGGTTSVITSTTTATSTASTTIVSTTTATSVSTQTTIAQPVLPATLTATSSPISQAGSSLLYPLFELWAANFTQKYSNIQLNTAAGGSGAGLSGVEGNTINIGASDPYMTAAQSNAYPGILNIPVAVSSQAVNYNLPMIPATDHLNMTGNVLAGIYNGLKMDSAVDTDGTFSFDDVRCCRYLLIVIGDGGTFASKDVTISDATLLQGITASFADPAVQIELRRVPREKLSE